MYFFIILSWLFLLHVLHTVHDMYTCSKILPILYMYSTQSTVGFRWSWKVIFRNAGVPRETCGGKILPVFRFARNLVQKKRARGSLLLSLLWRELENGKDFSAACFAGDPIWIEKNQKSSKRQIKKKKVLVGRVKIYFFVFWQTKSQIDHRKRYKTIVLLGFWY